MDLAAITVVILCGGRGTRAHPYTSDMPKPLMDVSGRPLLRHVMDIFAGQGCRRFVLAAGYKSEMVVDFAADLPGAWDVAVSDAGADAGTGTRIHECRAVVSDPFLATYGDGLADVDLRDLLAFHGAHGGPATLTSVPLRSQYGTVDTGEEDRVLRFLEKPVLEGHWINGGFFAFDRAVFGHWTGDDLEKEVLPGLAGAGLLYSYRHQGFWRSLDTHKDALELTALAEGGHLPWIRAHPGPS